MFCSSCGSRCHENVAFCSNCGSKVGGNIPSAQVSAQHSTIEQTVMVRDFRCNGCGAPLRIPQNSSAPVRCPSCKTECVIERLVRNAEMAAKENIASGIPLSATPAKLHKKLVSLIIQSPNIPMNIFEKAEVIYQHHHCVPAFYFRCNGTASYNYEAGKMQTRQEQGYKKNILTGDQYHTIDTIKEMDWTLMSGAAHASGEIIAPGNKECGRLVRDFYMFLDVNELYDFAELDYPYDVITHEFNLPQNAAFNEYVQPYIEYLLEKNATKAMAGRTMRNFALAGSRVEKEEIIRIFLGMYCIVLKYNNEEFPIWISGDGEQVIVDRLPVDEQQSGKEKEMENKIKSIPDPNTNPFTAGAVIGGIVAFIGFVMFINGYNVGGVIVHLLGLAGMGAGLYLRDKIVKPYKERRNSIRSKYNKEIHEMNSLWQTIVNRFLEQKKPLRGIFKDKVAGDFEAF